MRKSAWRLAFDALHVALATGALLTLAAAPLDGLGLVHAERARRPRCRRGCCRAALTLEHYRDLFTRLHVARHVAANSARRHRRRRSSRCCSTRWPATRSRSSASRARPHLRRLLAALVIPAQVAMLPLFLLLKQMGLVNTYARRHHPRHGERLRHLPGAPVRALDPRQRARRGAHRRRRASSASIWSLVLPLCRPILVTLAVFTFLGAWNDFLWPLIVLADERPLHAAGRARQPARRARAGHRADDGRRGADDAAGAWRCSSRCSATTSPASWAGREGADDVRQGSLPARKSGAPVRPLARHARGSTRTRRGRDHARRLRAAGRLDDERLRRLDACRSRRRPGRPGMAMRVDFDIPKDGGCVIVRKARRPAAAGELRVHLPAPRRRRRATTSSSSWSIRRGRTSGGASSATSRFPRSGSR